jgi:hypothetical protein
LITDKRALSGVRETGKAAEVTDGIQKRELMKVGEVRGR